MGSKVTKECNGSEVDRQVNKMILFLSVWEYLGQLLAFTATGVDNMVVKVLVIFIYTLMVKQRCSCAWEVQA